MCVSYKILMGLDDRPTQSRLPTVPPAAVLSLEHQIACMLAAIHVSSHDDEVCAYSVMKLLGEACKGND